MREHVIELVFDELRRAEQKFPGFPDDPVHAAGIIGEESGELMQAALDYYYGRGTLEQMRAEAVQTAAMAFRFLLCAPQLTEQTAPQCQLCGLEAATRCERCTTAVNTHGGEDA